MKLKKDFGMDWTLKIVVHNQRIKNLEKMYINITIYIQNINENENEFCHTRKEM